MKFLLFSWAMLSQVGCQTTPMPIEPTAVMASRSDLTVAAQAMPHKGFILDLDDRAFYILDAGFPGNFEDDRDLIDAMAQAQRDGDPTKASHGVFVTFAPPAHRGRAWTPKRVSRYLPVHDDGRSETFRAAWAADSSMGVITYDFSLSPIMRADCVKLEHFARETQPFAVPVLLDLKIVAGEAKIVKIRPTYPRHDAIHDTCG